MVGDSSVPFNQKSNQIMQHMHQKCPLIFYLKKKKFQNAVSKHLSNPSTLGGIIREFLGFKAILFANIQNYHLPANQFYLQF